MILLAVPVIVQTATSQLVPAAFSSLFSQAAATRTSTPDLDNVLTNQDLWVGSVLALSLAGVATYLRELSVVRTRVDGKSNLAATTKDTSAEAKTASNSTVVVYNDWSNMARPDNYVWFRRRRKEKESSVGGKKEQAWVLFALLLLFTPIFSFELALTVSRQLACLVQPDWCSPVEVLSMPW